MAGGYSLYYTLGDAWRSAKANLFTAVLSSATVGFALAIFTMFLIALLNIDAALDKWGERTHIVVYLKDGSLKGGVKSLKAATEAIAGVEAVKYVSSEKALELLKEDLEGHEGLLDGIGAGPLPASMEVTLDEAHRTPGGVKTVAGKLRAMVWADEVQFGTEWVEKLSALLSFIELAAVMVGSFLAAAVLFIISNTIRLAVYARGEEVEIMRYLGATNAFIKVPFFIEGVVQGLFGGLLALGVVSAGRYVLAMEVPPYMSFIVETSISNWTLLAVLLFSGAVMGAVGSMLSLGRFLKV